MEQKNFILAVAAIYLLALIAVGFWAKKRAGKVTDYLVAGRKLGLMMSACTIAAVQIGAGVIVGGAATGMTYGVWPGMYYALGCGCGCILSGIFIAGKMREVEGVVPMDYFEARFGSHRAIRAWAWLSNMPSMLGIFVAQLLACGSILAAFDIPFWTGVVACAAVILIYSSMGGMWSVVVGDTIQIVIIMVGVPVAAVAALVSLERTGVSALAAVFQTPFIPDGLFTKFIYMVTPMLVSISVSYDAFLRYQAAKDVRIAKWGCIIGGLITIFIGTAASAIGAAGHALFPSVSDGIFAYTVASTLSPLLAGLVVTAVLAAAMSSGNCLLLCMGASFSKDFYNKILHPTKSLEELPAAKKIARWTVIAACVAGVYFAFHLTNILDAIILFNYPYMGSMLAPLLAAVLTKNATVRGCYAGMGAGAAIGVACFLAGIPGPLSGWINPDMGLFAAYIVSYAFIAVFSATDVKKAPILARKNHP